MDTDFFPMTVQATADYLGVSTSTVYKYSMRGVLPCYRPTGGRLYFKVEDLREWVIAGRKSSEAELRAKALTMRVRR